MTNPSPEKRPRLRCQATTRAGVQCRSTAVSADDGLCSLHGGRLDPVELGRKGGRARGSKAKSKAGSFRDAIRRRLADDPDRYAAQLLASGAKGLELADKFIAEELEREKAEAGLIVVDGQAVTGLADVVRLAYAIGQAQLVGLPVSAEEVAALVATGVPPAPEERGTQVPSEEPAPRTPVSMDEELAPETDALVLEAPPQPDVRRSLAATRRGATISA